MSAEPIHYKLPLDAKSLSWITEEAEGVRDKELLLVEHINKNRAGLIKAEDFDETKHRHPIEVKTDSIKRNRTKLEKLRMKAKGKEKDCPIGEGQWDCMFWSEASIEKFFFPYYIAHRLLEPDEVARLKSELKDPDLIGFAHFTPSRPEEVDATDTGAAIFIQNGELTYDGVHQYLARLKQRVNR
jgi:hypothetical protein